jgi:hypothetical protein
MTDFVALSPTARRTAPDGYFQGGLMPAAGQDIAGLIIFDIRALGLSAKQGKALEANLRKDLHKRLEKLGVELDNRSAVDLGKSVFGMAFD